LDSKDHLLINFKIMRELTVWSIIDFLIYFKHQLNQQIQKFFVSSEQASRDIPSTFLSSARMETPPQQFHIWKILKITFSAAVPQRAFLMRLHSSGLGGAGLSIIRQARWKPPTFLQVPLPSLSTSAKF
jgi:hypothetical protein